MLEMIIGIILSPIAVLAIVAAGALMVGIFKVAFIKEDDGCKNRCKNCGKPITDYDQVEWEGNELRQTYLCSCGFKGEQVFEIEYIGTEDIR